MKQIAEPIRVSEVASELGVEVEELRRLAGKSIQKDALDREFIAAPTIRKLRDEIERQRLRDIEDAMSYAAYLQERSAARQRVYAEAYASGHQKSHKRDMEIARKIDSGELGGYASFKTGGIVNPQSRVRGSEAAVIATRKFDKKHPEPSGVAQWIELGRPRLTERSAS